MEGFLLPKHWNTPVIEDGVVQRWVEPEKAFEMSGWLYPSGAPMYEVRQDPLRPWRDELHKLPAPKDNNNFSPCAISFNEMKANAGEVKLARCGDEDENKRRARIARGQIARAQSKVKEWPREGLGRKDFYRAVTIVAGKVMRPGIGQERL
jgi:hypothetical protein